jgi:serine/threonine protein phosphatase PrpC
MRLRVGAATDTGRVRHLNEDVYSVRAAQGLFIVCDGMGGAPAGEVASEMATQTILEQLASGNGHHPTASTEQPAYLPETSHLAEAVRRSNHVIYNQAQEHPAHAGMGTTVVSAWIRHHIASVAHVGDSRAYLWHNHHLEPLTRDHSLVEAQVRAGVLDREQSGGSHEQHILLRVLGREPDVEVELNEVPVGPGDYVLLCSDGLTRMVSELTVAQTITRYRDPQSICDSLVDEANRNGGLDNITVVVVEVAGPWWRRLADGWRIRATGGQNGDARPGV